MKPSICFPLFLWLMVFSSCKKKKENVQIQKPKTDRVVLISVNAPEKYAHFVKQDSVGKELKDSIGPKAFRNDNGFTYLDYMNNVRLNVF